MRDVEYSLAVTIRAGLCINLAPGEQITRQHFDDAMDALNSTWADAAVVAGNGQLFADVLGPANGDWRGEVYDRNAVDGAEGEFDLRTDDEKAWQDSHPVSDWQYEVANGDTMLGYLEWLQHQADIDSFTVQATAEG